MKHRSLLTGAALSLGLALGPGRVQAEEDPLAPILEVLKSRQPEDFGLFRDSSIPGAPPMALWGELARAHPGGALETVQDFLGEFGSLLGVPAGAESLAGLAAISESAGEGGSLLTVAPAVDGVPFLSGGMTLQFSGEGTLVGVLGRYQPPGDVEMGSIDEARAVGIALEELARRYPGTMLAGDGSVATFLSPTEGGGAHRRYRVDVLVGEPPVPRRVMLGADGTVLWERIIGAASPGTGNVFVGYPGWSQGPGPLPYLTPPDPGTGLYRISGGFAESRPSFPWPAVSYSGNFHFRPHSRSEPFNGNREPPDTWFMETHVYHHLTRAHDQALNWGVPEVTRKRITFDVFHPPNPIGLDYYNNDNAFFSPGDWSIRFSRHNVKHPTNPAMDASVIYHEFGHVVHRAMQPFYDDTDDVPRLMEAWAVQEGFADCYAIAMTHSPHLGLNWGGGPYERTALNSMTYGEAMSMIKADKDPHQIGVLLSGTYQDLAAAPMGYEEAMRHLLGGLRRARSPVSFKGLSYAMMWSEYLDHRGSHYHHLYRVLNRRGLYP